MARMERLAKLLRIKQRQTGASNREIARAAGVAHTTISRVLEGRSVNLKTLQKISEWLEADPAMVMEDSGDDLTETIAAIIASDRRLESALTDAARKLKDGAITEETMREIIAYITWAIQR